MESWLPFALAGFALAGSPGPATVSLAATGAAFGARRGLPYLAGMDAVMALVAAGLTGMVLALPGVAPAVAVAAALYFAWLAFRIATAPPLSEDAGSRSAPSFAGGFALSLVNPKGYAAMAALFSGFPLLPGQPLAAALLKIAALTAVIVAVNLAWLAGGAALTRAFRNPRWSRSLNVTFAALLLAAVAAALRL